MSDGDGGAGPLQGTPKEDLPIGYFIYPPGGPGGDIMSSDYVFIRYGSPQDTLENRRESARTGMDPDFSYAPPPFDPQAQTSKPKSKSSSTSSGSFGTGTFANATPYVNPTIDYFTGQALTTTQTGTGMDIQQTMEEQAQGQGTQPVVTPTLMQEQPGELATTAGVTLGAAPTVTADQAATTGISTTVPTAPPAGVGQVGGIADVTTDLQQLGPAQAAQLSPTGPYVDMTGVQAGPSAGAIATAATQQLDQQATTQYQLSQLMSSLQSGGPMPPWAAPAVRKVNAVMQARGLGSSSMAAAAMTQALMESGVQIAQQDANKYATIQLQNLNNQQQTALANAATFAAMDKANLNARMQAAVTNAQSFLSVDLKNLDNQQKSDTLTYQSLVQGLFKDAAEDNARLQFNAKNELQVEEFFAELGAQVDTANANRLAAMEQFNVSEENAMRQFDATMVDSREKFNSNMQFAVDQSNVVWRREINTANTAIQNETNRINVQNAYNMTQNALNNLWQSYRDNAAWNFQKSENALQRQHDIGTIAMQYANTKDLYKSKQKDELAAGIGNWLATWAASD